MIPRELLKALFWVVNFIIFTAGTILIGISIYLYNEGRKGRTDWVFRSQLHGPLPSLRCKNYVSLAACKEPIARKHEFVEPYVINLKMTNRRQDLAFCDGHWADGAFILGTFGAFLLILGFFGCCGALTGNDSLICTFATLLTVIVLVEVRQRTWIASSIHATPVKK